MDRHFVTGRSLLASAALFASSGWDPYLTVAATYRSTDGRLAGRK